MTLNIHKHITVFIFEYKQKFNSTTLPIFSRLKLMYIYTAGVLMWCKPGVEKWLVTNKLNVCLCVLKRTNISIFLENLPENARLYFINHHATTPCQQVSLSGHLTAWGIIVHLPHALNLSATPQTNVRGGQRTTSPFSTWTWKAASVYIL